MNSDKHCQKSEPTEFKVIKFIAKIYKKQRKNTPKTKTYNVYYKNIFMRYFTNHIAKHFENTQYQSKPQKF